MITLCYTGHRPEILSNSYDWNSNRNQQILFRLRRDASNFILDTEYKHYRVYFGGALGIDQMAFNAWKSIRNESENLGIKVELYLAIPFAKYDAKWLSQIDKDRLKYQIQVADKVIYVDQEEGYQCKHVPIGDYHPSKNHIRNHYMVNNSEIVMAVWNGQKIGGTYECVKYAQKKGKQIIILNPDSIK